MSKTTVYNFFWLINVCYLCSVRPPLVAGKEHQNNAIARFVSARNKIEDIWFEVVKDNTSESGWAVDVMTTIPMSYTDNYFHVYMYAKERHRPNYRHYFFGDLLCTVVSNETSRGKYALGNFMPAQIMSMILPGRENSCQFEKGKTAIESEAPVNADRHDSMNKIVGIPYSFPFDLMVNIVKDEDRRDPVNNYMIQVNFSVDSNDEESGKRQENENNCQSSVERIPHRIAGTPRRAPVIPQHIENCVGNNNTTLKNGTYPATQSYDPINVPALVISVKNGIDNPYFSAVPDSNLPIGWAVKINKNLNRYRIDSYFLLRLYANNPNDDSIRPMYFGFLCDAIVYDSRWDDLPKSNFLPRQIVDIIFPNRQGSCDWQESTNPINKSGTVDLNPYYNPSVTLPNSTYYNLIANVLSQKYRNETSDVYFFQVNFTIGVLPSVISGPRSVSLNTH